VLPWRSRREREPPARVLNEQIKPIKDIEHQGGDELETPGDGEHRNAVLHHGPLRHAARDDQFGVMDSANAPIVENNPAPLLFLSLPWS
jgi:hypothetical protein